MRDQEAAAQKAKLSSALECRILRGGSLVEQICDICVAAYKAMNVSEVEFGVVLGA